MNILANSVIKNQRNRYATWDPEKSDIEIYVISKTFSNLAILIKDGRGKCIVDSVDNPPNQVATELSPEETQNLSTIMSILDSDQPLALDGSMVFLSSNIEPKKIADLSLYNKEVYDVFAPVARRIGGEIIWIEGLRV